MAIDYWRVNYENVSTKIVIDDYLQNYLIQVMDEESPYPNSEKLGLYLQNLKKDNGIISNIYIIDKTYHIIGTGDSDAIKSYVFDRISTAERNAGGVVWDSGYDTESLILFRNINNIQYNPNNSIGYLFIQINNDEVLQQFDRYRIHSNQRFSLKGRNDGFEVTEQAFFYNYYDNYKDLLHSEITIGNWYLRTWSDKTNSIEQTADLMGRLLLLVCIALVVSVLLCLIFTNEITKPIKKMKKTLEYYGTGDFSAKVEIRGHDEIASLGNVMNQMSEQISDLFDRVKKEENQRRKLELQTLVYQINPHFLYNTLDSINVLARQNGDQKVAEIVTDLSRLFRFGLNQGQEFIRVRDEILHVTYYLKIQEIRFEEQLKWTIDIDPQIMDVKMIKFVLQPLVENAIIHGIKSKDEAGMINITGRKVKEEIIFSISDSGEGMNWKKLQAVKTRITSETIQENSEGGFGLWNVHQRIRLCYGENFGLEISSKLGIGTCVEAKLPISEKEY